MSDRLLRFLLGVGDVCWPSNGTTPNGRPACCFAVLVRADAGTRVACMTVVLNGHFARSSCS